MHSHVLLHFPEKEKIILTIDTVNEIKQLCEIVLRLDRSPVVHGAMETILILLETG